MDRGFNFLFQGNRSGYNGPNYGRERADRSDRRYDDFYADRGVGRPGPNRPSIAGRRNDWGNSYQRPRNNPPPKFRRGSSGPRPGEKRKNETVASGFANKQVRKSFPTDKKKTGTKDTTPTKEKEDDKIEEIDIPDDEVVVPDTLMDSVEKLRQRKEVERNVADEDVQKLLVFCFTGKGYQCKTCGLLLMKESAFTNHLMGKGHVMNVIDARTAKKYKDIRDILEIDLIPDDWFEKNETARAILMKQSKLHMKTQREVKLREEANYNKTPSNFFNFNMELRKSVTKKDDKVIITSLVESTVEVKDFTGEKFFGCEFVRAVTGFHCRLCSLNIRDAKGVIPHVDSRQHKNNYQAYIRKNADYEKTQKEQNQDLFDIMEQHDGKSVVLAESPNVESSHFLSLVNPELVRIPSVMNPELKKEKEKEEKAADAESEKKKAEAETEESTEDCNSSKGEEEDAEEQEGGDEQEEGGEEEQDEEEEDEVKEGADEADEVEEMADEVQGEEDTEEAMEEGQGNVAEDVKVEEDEVTEEVAEKETKEDTPVADEDPYAETTESVKTKEKEESKKKTPKAAQPKKSILKEKLLEKPSKPPAKTTTKVPTSKVPAKYAKRASTGKTTKTTTPTTKKPSPEADDSNDGNAFQVVDEVEDDVTA